MNYLQQIRAFDDYKLFKHKLSSGQNALWYALMSINNKAGWIEWFTASNRMLELLTGLSKSGISKARNSLKQLGLIDIKFKGQNATAYHIRMLYGSNSNQESNQESNQDSNQDSNRLSNQVGNQESNPLVKHKHKLNKTNKRASSLAQDFEKLWKLYPSKKGKKKAFDAYKRAIAKGVTNKEIQDGIVALSRHVNPKYYPNGSTWFNGERWTDSYDTPEPPVSQSSKAQQETEVSPEIAKMKFIYNTFLDHDSDLEAAVPAIQAKRPELSEEDIKKALFPERYYKTEEW